MHLKQTKRNGRVYLSVVQNYRDGGTTKTKTVETIGYADSFADTYPDPIAHFRAYVDELNARQQASNAPISFRLARDARIEPGHNTAIQLGEAVALAYLDAFEVGRFFNDRAHATGFAVRQPGRFFELFCTARMLHAAPKHETWQSRASFPRSCPDDDADAYHSLALFAHEGQAMIDHLNRTYEKLRGARDLDHITLVFSNYVFRMASGGTFDSAPDEAQAGQWSRLCVAVDRYGIPLTYRIAARSATERQIRTLVDSVKAETGAQHVTLAAGRIANAEAIARELVDQGDGFVMVIPLEDRHDSLPDWVADDDGFRDIKKGTYALKSRTSHVVLPPSDEHGRSRTLAIREIALRGPRFRHDAERRNGAKTDGCLCIATNLTGTSDASIFNVYRELWRLHEPFQIIDADFISQPYPIPERDHLRAHFAISYAAFFLLRVMREDMGWAYNAATVADALMQLEGAYLTENWYLFNYRTDVTDAIEEAAGMSVGRRIMSRGDIRREIAQAKRHIRHEDGPEGASDAKDAPTDRASTDASS
jgi:hypothetical protein